MTNYDLHVLLHRYHVLKQFNDYQKQHTKKPFKTTQCRVCFKELKGKQRTFCEKPACKAALVELKERFTELQKENPNLKAIFWNELDSPNEKLEWNRIKGVEHKPYKIIKNVVTKRKPKSR